MTESEFLGVEAETPERWCMPITDDVAGGRGQLFGGCALAAALLQLEALTGKPAAWATAQFLANAFPPARVELDATVPADGYNFSQGRVIASVDGREILTVVAALGTKASFPSSGVWRTMPVVPPPEECEERVIFDDSPGQLHRRLEQRVVAGEWGDQYRSPAGLARVWIRFPDGLAGTTTGLSVAADFIPLVLRAALGRRVFGTSLDNTVRFVERTGTDWLLAEFSVDAISAGVGHGTVRLWSPDGRLLATGSQSCSMRDM